MNISVYKNIFERNDNAAEENRACFDQHEVTCLNLLGGAGCGKTTFLEMVLPRLDGRLKIGVLEGDLATTRDAERIAALNVPVTQLLTEGGCHLNATLVQHALAEMPLDSIDLLIIENVGNPICPSNFDLGEHLRVAVLSATEGDDKPAKYPLLFQKADMVVLSKCDLLPYTKFDEAAFRKDLQRLNPEASILSTGIGFELGIESACQWLIDRTFCERGTAGFSGAGYGRIRRVSSK